MIRRTTCRAKRAPLKTFAIACLSAAAAFVSGASAHADFASEASANWHRWRGPDASGVAPHGNPPLEWDGEKNVKWKIAIEGRGSASPIVWGNKLFILTAVDAGKKADGADEKTKNIHQFKVLCLDRNTGKTIWEKVAIETTPHEQLHETNTYASGSPTTDGQHLWVSFGSFGIYCYDLDGNLVWDRDLGDMTTRNQFGEGVSPTIHGDTLIINWDQEQDSKIFALNALTGATKWEKPRNEVTSWNTPIVVEGGGKTQVVVNGTTRSRGYDIDNGDVIWECGGQMTNAIASPVVLGNVVYCMTGFRGNAVYAIPLDAVGDITGADDKIAWKSDKSGPYVPSPILYGDRLYFCKMSNNIISCLDAKTGEALIDQKRVEGLKEMYASPVGADGRIYFTGRDGTTVVIRHIGEGHADELEVLATNKLGEPVDATPAIVGDTIYIRSDKNLYCIEEAK
jgi:outer membrane protein assembly factor BamB